jgi:ABC-type bacteriocin/lantibiotic exporter with double-glycine peptidase domain
VGIKMNSVSFDYADQRIISNVSLSVKRKNPLVLCGRSGKGKTTLANLMSGLYFPVSGEISYIGGSGKSYSSDIYAAKVGFVTQDIYLFHGTMRESLTAGRDCTDETIWSALDQVDGADFVRQLGGLNTLGAEAGRSLSGGQRRRLGIARVLLSRANILIFDEVTAGLDDINKLAVIEVIERLNEDHVVIVISHDRLKLAGQTMYTV